MWDFPLIFLNHDSGTHKFKYLLAKCQKTFPTSTLPHDMQRKIWHEIEEKDANFVDGHARVVDSIELLRQ